MIRPVLPTDAPALADLYNPYIRDTIITFEEQPVTAEEMGARIAKVTATFPWLVWEEDGTVLGYAYASTRPLTNCTVYAGRHSATLPTVRRLRSTSTLPTTLSSCAMRLLTAEGTM